MCRGIALQLRGSVASIPRQCAPVPQQRRLTVAALQITTSIISDD
jgi:hypothetical protein